MLHFDSEKLFEQFSAMDLQGRLAASAACSERLLPFYERFHKQSNSEEPWYQKCLEDVWGYLFGQVSIDYLRASDLLAVAMDLIPDEDDLGDHQFAQDAAISITLLLKLLLDRDPQNCVRCLEQGFNVAYSRALNSFAPTGVVSTEDEERAKAHLFTQFELAAQAKDIEDSSHSVIPLLEIRERSRNLANDLRRTL